MLMIDAEAAYLAGLFDGEGMVRINRAKLNTATGWYYTIHVVVTNTHLPVLEKLVNCFGGVIKPRIKYKPHHKQGYSWRICARSAMVFLRTIRPFLVIKGDEVDVAIRFQEGMVKRGNRWGLMPTELVAERTTLFEQLKEMKKREFPLEHSSLN